MLQQPNISRWLVARVFWALAPKLVGFLLVSLYKPAKDGHLSHPNNEEPPSELEGGSLLCLQCRPFARSLRRAKCHLGVSSKWTRPRGCRSFPFAKSQSNTLQKHECLMNADPSKNSLAQGTRKEKVHLLALSQQKKKRQHQKVKRLALGS